MGSSGLNVPRPETGPEVARKSCTRRCADEVTPAGAAPPSPPVTAAPSGFGTGASPVDGAFKHIP